MNYKMREPDRSINGDRKINDVDFFFLNKLK